LWSKCKGFIILLYKASTVNAVTVDAVVSSNEIIIIKYDISNSYDKYINYNHNYRERERDYYFFSVY
jgi:hypothetical protein